MVFKLAIFESQVVLLSGFFAESGVGQVKIDTRLIKFSVTKFCSGKLSISTYLSVKITRFFITALKLENFTLSKLRIALLIHLHPVFLKYFVWNGPLLTMGNRMGKIDKLNLAYILPLMVSLSVGAKNLSITTSIETRTSIFKSSAEDDHLSNSLIIKGDYELYRPTALTFYGKVEKDHLNERRTELKDSYLGLAQKIYLAKDALQEFTLLTRIYLPATRQETKYDSLRTALSIAGLYTHKFGRLSLHYKLEARKNFHQYATSTAQKHNTEYSLMNLLNIEYSFSDKFSLAAYIANISPWSYHARKKADYYEVGQSALYQFNKKTAWELGHTYGDSSTNSNGSKLNFNIADEYASTLYTTIHYAF